MTTKTNPSQITVAVTGGSRTALGDVIATLTARVGTVAVGPVGAATSATNVVAAAPVGDYRVSFCARTTTSGTGTTATVSVIWTDEGGVKTFTSATFALNSVTVTGQVNGTVTLHAVAASNIQVSVAGTFGTSLYSMTAVAEKLN